MKIRKLRKKEVDLAQRIIYSCIDSAIKINKKDRLFLKELYTKENLYNLQKDPDIFSVNLNSKIIGIGRIKGNKIATVYFDPKDHRKGGGKLILCHLQKIAKKRNITTIYVDSLLQSTGFYERLGFKKIKIQNHPIRFYKMKKRL